MIALLAAHVFFVLAGRLFDGTWETLRPDVALRIGDDRIAAAIRCRTCACSSTSRS